MSDKVQIEKEQAFIKKHKPIVESKGSMVNSSRTIEDVMQEEEMAKSKYNSEMAIVEAALTEFLDIKDPIVWNKKAIAWVRRPTMKELKILFPTDMLNAMSEGKSIEDLSPEKAEEYDNTLYGIMGDLIVIPKFTGEQWKSKSNPYLIKLFYDHIAKIALILQPQVENF